MPGPFDDLVPGRDATRAGGGSFDDLLPAEKRAPGARTDGKFADLVPKRGVLKDMAVQAVGGVRDAAQSILDLSERGAAALEKHVPLGSITWDEHGLGYTREFERPPDLPEVPEAATVAGRFTRGGTQFATGLIPAVRFARVARAGAGVERLAQALGASEKFAQGAGLVAGTEVAAHIADQIAFDPFGRRLSNIVEEHPSIANPVTAYLAAEPNDSEAEARFKVALEGTALGAVIPGLLVSARRLRSTLRRRPVPTPAVTPGTAPAAPQATTDGPSSGTASGAPPRSQASTLAPVPSAAARPDTIARAGEATQPRPRAGNINLDRIDAPEAVKSVLTDTARQFGREIDEARRGVITEEQTRQLASDLSMTPEQLTKRRAGQAFSAEEAYASRELLVSSADDVAAKAKAATGGSDEALLEFRRALERHAGVQAAVSGMTAEAGRALRQFRMTVGPGTGNVDAVKTAIESFGGRESVEELARLASAIDTREGLNRFARDATKVKTSDQLLEVWINALLSGPQTHVVNALSNTLTAAWTLPEHLLAAGIGATRRGADRVRFREVAARAFGAVQGMRDGLRAAAKAFATEEPSDLFSKIETSRHQTIPSATFRRGAEKSTLAGMRLPFTGELTVGGKQVRLPGRLLQASDEFFKTIAYRAELNARAMRDGLSKDLSGHELAKHIAGVLRDPPKEFSAAALDGARYQTFTNPLGPIGQAVSRIAAAHPALRLIVPFIRTPTNIVKYAAERSPFGLLMRQVRDNLRAGGATRDIQLARLSLGTGIGAMVAQLASEGLITGSGPTDRIARAALRDTGWLPYAAKLGDRYVSFSRLEPLGMLLGVAADLGEIGGELDDGELDDVAARIAGSISSNLTSKTYLRGISELVEAISDPDRYGDRYVQNLAGTLVPTGVAQLARTRDPVLRDARGILDTLKSRIPGYSETLPARRNMWGEPVILSGGVGPDLISPLYSSTDRQDPLSHELARLNVRRSLPDRKIRGVELTPEQYSRYSEQAGRAAKRILERVVADPGYAQLPDDVRRELFGRMIDRSRSAVRERFLPEIAPQPARSARRR